MDRTSTKKNRPARSNQQGMGVVLQANSEFSYEPALRLLFDWLNTRFTLLPNVGRIAMAAKARKTSNRAYSTKSWPSSSLMKFFMKVIICVSPFVWMPFLIVT